MKFSDPEYFVFPRQGLDLTSLPLVSIVMPVYNAVDHLKYSIDSVLAQTHGNWELLIVIDCKSSDASLEIARRMALSDIRIQVITSDLCTDVSSNRNKAIEEAKGQFVAFLDSDDIWLPEKLAYQVSFMEVKKVNISYHSFDVINEDGGIKGPRRQAKYRVGYRDLLKNNCMGCLTVMVRRSFIKDKRMKNIHHEDLHFWLQLLQEGGYAFPIKETLAQYRIRKNSLSENKIQCAIWRWQLYRHLKLSVIASMYYMVLYTVFAIKKRV